MKVVVPLADAIEEPVFGAKAVGLGDAIRADLPVPPGVALSGAMVEAIASGDAVALDEVVAAARALPRPLAVRSSCVDEDGAQASFAGQHLTLLNVLAVDDLESAVRDVWWSANSDSAITYRQRVGLFSRPSVGVVVQTLLDPEVAGVMFTRNPVNGADERMIEASWGLGEAVVSGVVIPDHFRVAPSGEALERTPGRKKIAIRRLPDGGTVEEDVASELVERLCLDDGQLTRLNELARRCEEVFGPGRDIEWAFAGGALHLLQCRAMTRAGTGARTSDASRSAEDEAVAVPIDTLARVPIFADLDERELDEIGTLFKVRRFAAGETVAKEGSGGAAFFVITAGTATVSVRGQPRATLGPGDHFGEVALIDAGARTATVTASDDLVCYGLTFWDFGPFVRGNGTVAWKLLQTLAERLREATEVAEA